MLPSASLHLHFKFQTRLFIHMCCIDFKKVHDPIGTTFLPKIANFVVFLIVLRIRKLLSIFQGVNLCVEGGGFCMCLAVLYFRIGILGCRVLFCSVLFCFVFNEMLGSNLLCNMKINEFWRVLAFPEVKPVGSKSINVMTVFNL